LTDVCDIGTPFKKVRAVEIGDIVRLLGDFKKTKNGMLRFKCEFVPGIGGAEDEEKKIGFITRIGNKDKTFLCPYSSGYVVRKETVLTDKFEMSAGFKPLARLKVNEKVRAIGFPMREGISKLIRVKAVTLNPKNAKCGYVTVEGNQGSAYLEACTLDIPEEEEEKDEPDSPKKEGESDSPKKDESDSPKKEEPEKDKMEVEGEQS